MLVRYFEEGPQSSAFKEHIERLRDFFWMVNTTSGVQTWDTAFAVQAVVVAGLTDKPDPYVRSSLHKALQYFENHQMEHTVGYEVSPAYSNPPTRKTCAEVGYHHPRAGAWGFSEKKQGYPVSDCTAETLKAVLLLQSTRDPSNREKPLLPMHISETRLQAAADILLTYQEADGGCSCYEPRRGGSFLEYLNPAQVFDKLMVPYSYPECTGSCLTALHLFHTLYPHYRSQEILDFIRKGISYICKTQRPDGSWRGSWGICFTYAAYFTLEALATQGQNYANSDTVRRACEFLVDKQNEDGGWGEAFESAVTGVWHDHPDGSQVVQTAWSLVALLEAKYPFRPPLERGVRLLMERQLPSGRYLQEDVEGAHNVSWYFILSSHLNYRIFMLTTSSVLKYPNYKFIFPMKALGMFSLRFEGLDQSA